MKQESFIKKREELLEQLPNKSLALIYSANIANASNDTDYPYQVNRNFYYFTGIAFPGMFLLLYKSENSYKEILCIPRVDPEKERWTAKMYTPDECTYISGIESVIFIDQMDDLIWELAAAKKIIKFFFYSEPVKNLAQPSVNNIIRAHFERKFPGVEIDDLSTLTVKMRSVKTPAEIEVMRIAARITKQAFDESVKRIKPGIREYEVQAAFEYVVKRHGAKVAFNSIVASGKNATILHYTDNNAELKDGELILMDCGASYEWYNSDVTRTYPVNGTFSDRQLEIYNIVLAANKTIIKAVRPGISCTQLNNLLIQFYRKELKAAGLISEDNEVAEYYYHGVSHSLGLDVHDVFDKDLPLAPGMVVTVEPGLYFAKYNIGVRIEDDVLVTQNGCEVLTADIAKDPAEIEEMMNIWEVK